MKSSFSFILSIFLIALFSQAAQGFQPITSSALTFKQMTESNAFVLQASLIDPDQEPDKNDTWEKVVEINNKFWDYTVNFFYVFMTCGILLNLTGFAYKVDLENGLTVQTVKERRQELQWEREMQRYDQEIAMKQKTLLDKSIGGGL